MISRMDKKEIRLFREYATYKKRKKALLLFESILKFKDQEESETFFVYLKRKKLYKNLTRNSNELFQLKTKFWNDNSWDEALSVDISNQIYAATILEKQGLIEDAIYLYKKAEKQAFDSHYYYLAIECNKRASVWSRVLHPKNTEEILEQYKCDQELLINTISDDSYLHYLNHKIFYLLYKGVWCLSTSEEEFLVQARQDIEQITKEENKNAKTRLIAYSLLGTLYQYTQPTSSKLSKDYAIKTIKLLESSKGMDNILNHIVSLFNLSQLYYFEDNKLKFTKCLHRFRKLKSTYKRRDARVAYYHFSFEFLNCQFIRDYTFAIDNLIPSYLNFFEKNMDDIPFTNHWDMNFSCFEIYFAVGNFEKAEHFCGLLRTEKLRKSSLTNIKFIARICELLLNLELGNIEYVSNQGESIRRLYSSYLAHNKSGKLLLKYLMTLALHDNKKARIPIYIDLQTALKKLLDDFYLRRIFVMTIIPDWIEAKIGGFESIDSWAKSKL